MSSDWSQYPQDKALNFLGAVRDEENSILFEPSVCEVFSHPLDFFDGYDLIRISNQYSPPFMLLDYVSNGEDHFYLDGSDHAFQTLCKKKSVRLTLDNVLDYIDLYFSYVYERGNTVVYIHDNKDSETRAEWNEARNCFVIHLQLIYQDEKREAVLHVQKNGQIDITSPASISFLDDPQIYQDIQYAHPRADSILEQAQALLSMSETANVYMQEMADKDVEIRIISSPNYQAVTFNKPVIYLFIPAAQYTADYHQALLLGGAMHDAQQILSGYKRPSVDEDDVLFFNINHDKNLKLIAGMCKIVEELEEHGIEEAVQAITNLNLLPVYNGFKEDISAEFLMDRYIQALRDSGIITGDA